MIPELINKIIQLYEKLNQTFNANNIKIILKLYDITLYEPLTFSKTTLIDYIYSLSINNINNIFTLLPPDLLIFSTDTIITEITLTKTKIPYQDDTIVSMFTPSINEELDKIKNIQITDLTNLSLDQIQPILRLSIILLEKNIKLQQLKTQEQQVQQPLTNISIVSTEIQKNIQKKYKILDCLNDDMSLDEIIACIPNEVQQYINAKVEKDAATLAATLAPAPATLAPAPAP
jgi:hypothetical protein